MKKIKPIAPEGQPVTVEEVTGPHEAISIDEHQQASSAGLTAYDRAKIDVATLGKEVPREWIAARKNEYSLLKINGIDDKEGEKMVKAAYKDIRDKRLAVEKKRKELKEGINIIGQAVDKEARELKTLLEEIEDPLKQLLDEQEAERERIKQQKETEAQQRLHDRIAILTSKGMAYNGAYYAVGEVISVDVVALKSMSDDDFKALEARVQKEWDAQQAAEKERLEQEEAEKKRLAQEKADLEAEKRALAAERAEVRMAWIDANGFHVTEDNRLAYRTTRVIEDGPKMHRIAYVRVLPESIAEFTALEWEDTRALSLKIKSDVENLMDHEEKEYLSQQAAKKESERRRLALAQIGIIYHAGAGYVHELVTIKSIAPEELNAAQFEDMLQGLRISVNDAVETKQAKDRKKMQDEKIAALRANDLKHAGYSLMDGEFYIKSKYDIEMFYSLVEVSVNSMTEDEWAIHLSNAQAQAQLIRQYDVNEKLREDAEKEKKRVAALSDADSLNEYLDNVLSAAQHVPSRYLGDEALNTLQIDFQSAMAILIDAYREHVAQYLADQEKNK